MELNTDFIREAIKGYARANNSDEEITKAAYKTLDALEGLVNKWKELGDKIEEMRRENAKMNNYEVYVMRYAEKSYTVRAKNGDAALERGIELAENDALFEDEQHFFKAQLVPFGDED